MQSYKTEKHLFSGGCWKWGKLKSLESYSECGEKEQPRIQPSRQPRRGDKSESGAKANWSSTSAGRTKWHLFFIYWVLFSGSCVKLKIQSIVIAQNLSCILSMPVYKKRIISYFSSPEKGKKKKRQNPICASQIKIYLHMTGQWFEGWSSRGLWRYYSS